MTRADVLKLFPTATEEQVTAFLNQYHSEAEAAKTAAKNERTASAEEIAKLQTQLEELQNKDVPDVEKFQKQIDKLTADYQAAQKTIKNMELKNGLLGQGISEDDANSFIEAINSDSFDVGVIGTIISNAVAASEKEKMNTTPEPNGASKGTQTETKSDAEKLASVVFGDSSKTEDVLSHYIK